MKKFCYLVLALIFIFSGCSGSNPSDNIENDWVISDIVDENGNVDGAKGMEYLDYLYSLKDSEELTQWIEEKYPRSIKLGSLYNRYLDTYGLYFKLRCNPMCLYVIFDDMENKPFILFTKSESEPFEIDKDFVSIKYNNHKSFLSIDDFPYILTFNRKDNNICTEKDLPITVTSCHYTLGASPISFGNIGKVKVSDTNNADIIFNFDEFSKLALKENYATENYMPPIDYFYSDISRQVTIIFKWLDCKDLNMFKSLETIEGISDVNVIVNPTYDRENTKKYPTTTLTFAISKEYQLYGKVSENITFTDSLDNVDSKLTLYTKLIDTM